MTSKHTPGPWRVERQNPSPTTGEYMVAGATAGYLAEVRDCGGGNVLANATLIAAAPELLQALEACINYGSMTGDDWVIEKARAAIAKATGGAE